jgi:hypothetical protein
MLGRVFLFLQMLSFSCSKTRVVNTPSKVEVLPLMELCPKICGDDRCSYEYRECEARIWRRLGEIPLALAEAVANSKDATG